MGNLLNLACIEGNNFLMRRYFKVLGVWLCYVLLIGVVVEALVQVPFKASASNHTWQEYTYSGPTGGRSYFVYTPESYQARTVVPLVVMLHGCFQKAVDFAAGSGMNQLADHNNFIVVYPQEAINSNGDLCWNWFLPENQVRDSGEPAIIAGIVRAVKQHTSQWRIDPKRVYVAGGSAGAAMAGILGATYPDIFAAIAVHSGSEYPAGISPIDALKSMGNGGPDPVQQGQAAYHAMGAFARAMPTIVFHGTNDPIVNPINGDQVVQQWMETDTLASSDMYNAKFSSPTSTTPGRVPGGYAYTVYTWNDTNGNELQEYWKVDGLGHAWSGGNLTGSYTDPLGPDASRAMYSFFLSHPQF